MIGLGSDKNKLQLLALQWVHDHIADFGGDPDRVTIQVNNIRYCCIVTSSVLFSSITWRDGDMIYSNIWEKTKDILFDCQGESAGSASVTYHLLSPLSQRNVFEQNRCHTLVHFTLLTNSLCSLLPPSDRRVRLSALRMGFRFKAWATWEGGLLLKSLFVLFSYFLLHLRKIIPSSLPI